MGKLSDCLTDPGNADIKKQLPRISNWTTDQKRVLCDNMVRLYRGSFGDGMPKRFEEFCFDQVRIGYDKTFWAQVGLPYSRADNYLPDIRTAVALFYYDQLSELNCQKGNLSS